MDAGRPLWEDEIAEWEAGCPVHLPLAALTRREEVGREGTAAFLLVRRLVFMMVAAAAIGCGSPVKEEVIEIKTASDPLSLPKSVLQNYAGGQSLGSEVTSFPKMVEDLRKADPAKADILEKGLQELQQAAPEARAGLAKSLLEKL